MTVEFTKSKQLSESDVYSLKHLGRSSMFNGIKITFVWKDPEAAAAQTGKVSLMWKCE